MKIRSVVPMRIAKYGYIFISILLCVLGISMILLPTTSVRVIGRLLGIALLSFGIIKLVGYFSKDLYRLAFQFDLQFGILFLVLGAVALIHPATTMNFICIVLGICIFLDCLFKIKIIFDAKRFGIKEWWLTLVLALLAGVAGFLLLIRPSEAATVIVTLLGIALLTEGILNLDVALSFVKIIRHQRPETIDADYVEIK